MSKEAMKLALEALEWNMGYLPSYGDGTRMAINAITALREALAEQPAQRKQVGDSRFERWYSEDFEPKGKGTKQQMREAYEAGMNDPSPPAQRKPLTDEDCTRIYNDANGITIKNPPITTERIFKAMRAAHGIKENT